MAKGKYADFYDLGEEQLLVLERGIRAGIAKAVLARKLQAKGMFPHLTAKKLAVLLAGYEKDVLDRALMRRFDEAGLMSAARQAAQLNLNDEMMTSIALQRRRVERAMEIAEKTPALLVDQHGKEIERYMSMLDKTARVQMELGIITKAPKRVTTQLMRDANNPNMLTIEVTEQVLAAADDVMGMIDAEFVALPAPGA